jgi:hypothetical protein
MPKFEFNEQEGFDLVMSNFNPDFIQSLVERLTELGEFERNPDLLLKLSEGVFYYHKEHSVVLSPEQQKCLKESGNIKLDDCLSRIKEK